MICYVQYTTYNGFKTSSILRPYDSINDATSIAYKLRDDVSIFEEGTFESLFIEITLNGVNHIIGEIKFTDALAQMKDISLIHMKTC